MLKGIKGKKQMPKHYFGKGTKCEGVGEEVFLEHKRILELEEDTLERINLYTILEMSLLSGGGNEKQRKE